MRSVVIAGEYPWPEDRGPRMRLATVLAGLRRVGSVELCSVISQYRSDFDPPDEGLGLAEVARIGFDNRPSTGLGLLGTLARPSMPMALPWRDGPRVRRGLARFLSGRYDLVWFFGAWPWVLAGEPSLGSTVLDLFDLEDHKIAARLSIPASGPSPVKARLRRSGSRMVAREEMRRWQRLHRRAAARVSAVVVSSDLDAGRAGVDGLARIAVVPNGYRPVDRPVGRIAVGSPPTVLFQGLLTYPPNIEAAHLLVEEIGPLLRTLVPEVQIRLVGEHHPPLEELDDPPRVTVVGRVAEITTELARADVVVVPLRYGSGTRLKIVESFAHRVPVVSTPLGAEGLEALDRTHLLLGADASELAEATARLLREPDLRASITGAAHALFLERFSTTGIEATVARLAEEVAGR